MVKIKLLMINWKIRIKNPVFWIQIGIGVILTALAYNSMQPQDLTTWSGVVVLIKEILNNPYLLCLCIYNGWCAVNDPTSSGISDSSRVLKYKKVNSYKGN